MTDDEISAWVKGLPDASGTFTGYYQVEPLCRRDFSSEWAFQAAAHLQMLLYGQCFIVQDPPGPLQVMMHGD